MSTWSKSTPLGVKHEPHLPVLQKAESMREVGEKSLKHKKNTAKAKREELLKLAALHKSIDGDFHQASPNMRRLAISAELPSSEECGINNEATNSEATINLISKEQRHDESLISTSPIGSDPTQTEIKRNSSSDGDEEVPQEEIRRASSSSLLCIDPARQVDSTEPLSQSLPNPRISSIMGEALTSHSCRYCFYTFFLKEVRFLFISQGYLENIRHLSRNHPPRLD